MLCFTFLAILLLIFARSAFADSVTLAWDANQPDPDGYMIYFKTDSSGPPYNGVGALEGDSPITVELAEFVDPDNPEYTLNDLSNNEIYFSHFL